MYINIHGIAKIGIEIEEAENVFYHGCCIIFEAINDLFQNLNPKSYLKQNKLNL